LSSVAVASDE
jgi:hypothetical protein